MKFDSAVKLLLLLMGVSLGTIAVQLYIAPRTVQAQSGSSSLYFEPGTFMLRAPDGSRQVLGKVAVDLSNGNVWGFPTLQQDPYPAQNVAPAAPPVSHPFLLGKFALGDMSK
jgi:hypothetical protein